MEEGRFIKDQFHKETIAKVAAIFATALARLARCPGALPATEKEATPSDIEQDDNLPF